jgi:hypothetical protein
LVWGNTAPVKGNTALVCRQFAVLCVSSFVEHRPGVVFAVVRGVFVAVVGLSLFVAHRCGVFVAVEHRTGEGQFAAIPTKSACAD